MIDSIKTVIMRRDGISSEEADELIQGAKAELEEVIDNGGDILDAEEVVKDWFGLEPDYLMEIMPL